MNIQEITANEIDKVLSLVWKVFNKFEAPNYSKEGINSFYNSIHDEKYLKSLKIFGAYVEENIVGVIATRNEGNHIALFFVDEKYQKQGIGKKLFNMVCLYNNSGKITVNSSLFARDIYKKLGFFETSPEKVTDGIKYYPMEFDIVKLTSERLILRPWRIFDAKELYKYAKDKDIGPIAGWPPHTSVSNSEEIIKSVLSMPETYAVILKETNLPVGSVGIMFKGNGSAPIEEDEAEVGYWIGKPYWGNGLIPEAVRILLKRCFCDFNLKGVWCGYYDGNQKSKRVQEKCGFIYHHSNKNTISPMGDKRCEHFTYIKKEDFFKNSLL